MPREKEVVAIVRVFNSVSVPPTFEVQFQKNVKAGEKLKLDSMENPTVIYRIKK